MSEQGDASFSEDEEKRIRHIVYCAEQLMTKRLKLWNARYERAVSAARSIEELDEAMRRVHAKYPQLGLDSIIEAQPVSGPAPEEGPSASSPTL